MHIALDAGHGQDSATPGVYDPGANLQGYQEHKLAKELVDNIAADLAALGHKTYLPTGPYKSRDDKAKAAGVDFYLSVHFNGGPGSGTEAFVNTSSSTPVARAFAEDASARMAKTMGIKDRGMKYANWAVLSANRNDALIEVCFPADVQKYLAKKEAVELAILNALLKAHGQREVASLPRKVPPAPRQYKVMACSTDMADTEFDRAFDALCKKHGKASFETKDAAVLPTWHRGWYRRPL